jgi:lipopolysaccharide export LptBFGC system permease protein LptF
MERAEVAGTRRGAWVALGVTLVATALLELPPLQSFAGRGSRPMEIDIGERVRMATYLLPSTLLLSVPLGLAVATAWILHGPARTRKVAGVALVTAMLTSFGTFGNLAWVTPDANQAFRETVMAQYTPPGPVPSRGTNELRLPELRERLREARASLSRNDVNQIEVAYYRKWTISVMPLAIVALIVALAFRRAWTRAGLTGIACVVLVAQYALLMFTESLADLGVARPIVLEWTGNVLWTAAAAITWSRSRARPA